MLPSTKNTKTTDSKNKVIAEAKNYARRLIFGISARVPLSDRFDIHDSLAKICFPHE